MGGKSISSCDLLELIDQVSDQGAVTNFHSDFAGSTALVNLLNGEKVGENARYLADAQVLYFQKPTEDRIIHHMTSTSLAQLKINHLML